MDRFAKIKEIGKSLRYRIVFYNIVTGVLPVTILSLFIISLYEQEMIDDKLNKLQSTAVILKNNIISTDYLETGVNAYVDACITNLISGDKGRIMVIDKDFVVISDTYNIDNGRTYLTQEVVQCFKGENRALFDNETQKIKITVSLSGTNNTGGVLLLEFSTQDITGISENIKMYIFVGVCIAVVLVIAVAWAAGFYTQLPFEKLKAHIRELDAGKHDNLSKDFGYTEAEEIGTAMEEVILRLKKVDESREEFVSNVSHELKTPITSIKVLADSLMSQEEVPNEMYREFMQDIASEIDRESSIINDLLTLVRMNKNSSDLKVSSVNIADIVNMVIRRVRPIAEKRDISVNFENFKPVMAEVDEVKIAMVFTNLIENAVKYNVDGGFVNVSLNADVNYCYFKVSDSGIGIPDDAKLQVFERFFRVDKARSRQTGGTGLGLAIASSVINMHKGEIRVYSKEGEGSTFTVKLPLHYVS